MLTVSGFVPDHCTVLALWLQRGHEHWALFCWHWSSHMTLRPLAGVLSTAQTLPHVNFQMGSLVSFLATDCHSQEVVGFSVLGSQARLPLL
jgi:hypothetical protein